MDENLARCAQANFENLARQMPQILRHPFFVLAKAQLDEALGDVGALQKAAQTAEENRAIQQRPDRLN